MKTFKKLLIALLTIALLSSAFLIATFAQDGAMEPGDLELARSFLTAAESVTDVFEKSENIAMFDEYMSTHVFDETSDAYKAVIAEAERIKNELTTAVLTEITSSEAYSQLFGSDFDTLKLSKKKHYVSQIYSMLLAGYTDEMNESYKAFRVQFAAIEAAVIKQFNEQKSALLQNAPPAEYFYPESSQLFFYDFEDGKTIPKHSLKGADKFVIEPNGVPYSNGAVTSLAPSNYYLHIDGDGDKKTDSYIQAITFDCQSKGYDAFVLEYDIFYKGEDLQLNVNKINNKDTAMFRIRSTGIEGRAVGGSVHPYENSALPQNAWSHVSMVYNHKEQMCYLYIDYEYIGSHVFATDPNANVTEIRMFGYCDVDSVYIDNLQGYYGTQPRQLDYADSLTPDKLLEYYYGVCIDSGYTYEERLAAKEWFANNQMIFGTYTLVDGEYDIDYNEGYSEETVGQYIRGFLDYDLERSLVLVQVEFLMSDQETEELLAVYESLTELMKQKGYLVNGEFNTAYEGDSELKGAVDQYLSFDYEQLLTDRKIKNLAKLEEMHAAYLDLDHSSYTSANDREAKLAEMSAFVAECGAYIDGHEKIVEKFEAETARIARDRHVAQVVTYIEQYEKALTPAAKLRWYNRIVENLIYEEKSILTFTDLREITDEKNGIPARLAVIDADLLDVDKQNNSSYIVGRANLIQKTINEIMVVQPTDERYPTEVLAILLREGEIRDLLFETYRAEIIAHVVASDEEVFNRYVEYFYDDLVIELYESDLEVQQYFYNRIRAELIEELIDTNDEVRVTLAKALGVPTTKVEIEAVMDLLAQDDVTNTYVNGFISTDIADAAYSARVLDMANNDADAKAMVDSHMRVTPTTDSFLDKIERVSKSAPSEAMYMQEKIDGVYMTSVMTLLDKNSELKAAIDAKLDLTEGAKYADLIASLLRDDAEAKAAVDRVFVTQRFEELLQRVSANSAIKNAVKAHLTDLLDREILGSLIAGENYDYNTLRYLRIKMGLKNGEEITLDAVLALMETDSEAAVYLELRKAERLSERVFPIIESNTELNTALRANIEAIRAILNSGNYVTNYDGLDFAVGIFKVYNDYYYAILQDEHIAELSKALVRYDGASSYIDRCGIYLYMKDYLENQDIDFANYPFFNETLALLDEYYHNLYDIPEGSEYSEEEEAYRQTLKVNTEIFIAAVDQMHPRMNYQQLTEAIMQIREYYYHISIETPEAKDSVAIFESYEKMWNDWKEANEEFIAIVGALRTADTIALRFDVLSRANALLEKVDESYPGAKETLSTYNAALAAYEAETTVVNDEIAETADILCAQRASRSSVANVVAVLRKKYY